MDQEIRERVCRLVAGIVVADDHLDPAEDAFIDRMLAGFGLDAGDREAIFPIIDRNQAADEMRHLPRHVQREAMDLLVGAAVADGRVVDEERGYLHAVAAAIDYAPGDLDLEIQRRLKTGPG